MNVTRNQVEKELEKLIRGAAHIADTHFGQGAGAAMLRVKDAPGSREDLHFDVNRFPIYAEIMRLYEYAINATWVTEEEELDTLTHVEDFVFGIASAPLMSFYVPAGPEICGQLFDTANARWKLEYEEGGDLTIGELALLAKLDERSVRNAASKNEFKTKKSGNQVFIEPDDARAWLIKSRNFKETDRSKQPEPNAVPFETIEITDGNLRNHHLYLKDVMHFFPDDVIGGRNKARRASRELTMHCGLENGIETDIDGDKKIFRRHGWLGDFFNRHHLVAGDSVVIERLDDYKYHLYPARG